MDLIQDTTASYAVLPAFPVEILQQLADVYCLLSKDLALAALKEPPPNVRAELAGIKVFCSIVWSVQEWESCIDRAIRNYKLFQNLLPSEHHSRSRVKGLVLFEHVVGEVSKTSKNLGKVLLSCREEFDMKALESSMEAEKQRARGSVEPLSPKVKPSEGGVERGDVC